MCLFPRRGISPPSAVPPALADFTEDAKYNDWVGMNSTVLQVRAIPAGRFTLSPNWPFAIAGTTLQPQTLFSITREAKAVFPTKEFMKMSPRSSFEMEDGSMEKLNINQHSLSGRDKWDIIIYYKYFSVWNQNTNSQHLAQYKSLQKRLAKYGW